MEEEIDLRGYVAALLHRWWWIVGLTLLAAIAGLVLSLLSPAVYGAEALAFVTQPHYEIQFDSRIETTQDKPAYKAFPTLATSDEVLQTVVIAYSPPADAHIGAWSLAALSSMVQASSQGDPSLLVLRVRSQSAQAAADIANAWADALVDKGNAIYDENAKDVDFLESQASRAKQTLSEAEEALIEFQSRNQGPTYDAQLASLEEAQTGYLSTQITVTNLIQDIQGLHRQLAKQPSGQPASLADSLTVLLLQVKAFNAQASIPVQLQVSSGEPLSGMNRQEQIAFLEDLATTLQNRSVEIEARLAALEPEILALQRKVVEAQTELDRLTRQQNLTRETYVTLARKLEETRIAAQTEGGTFRVGSYASVPQTPVARHRLRNSAVAGLAGLLLGVLVVSAAEWWRK